MILDLSANVSTANFLAIRQTSVANPLGASNATNRIKRRSARNPLVRLQNVLTAAQPTRPISLTVLATNNNQLHYIKGNHAQRSQRHLRSSSSMLTSQSSSRRRHNNRTPHGHKPLQNLRLRLTCSLSVR
jgi:hypothetical protein